MEKYAKGQLLLCSLESLVSCKGLKTSIQKCMKDLGVTGYVQKVYNPSENAQNDGPIPTAKTKALALGPTANIKAFVKKMEEKLPKNRTAFIKILGDVDSLGGFLDMTAQEMGGPCIRETIGKLKTHKSDDGNMGDGKPVNMSEEVKEGIFTKIKRGAMTAVEIAKYIPGISKDVKDLESAVSDTSIHDDPTYMMTAKSLFKPYKIVNGLVYTDDLPNIARAYIERDAGIPYGNVALFTREGVEVCTSELLRKEAETGVIYVDTRKTEAFFSSPKESALREKLKPFIEGEWFYHCLAAENITVAKINLVLTDGGATPEKMTEMLVKNLGISQIDAYVIVAIAKKL